MIIHTSVLIIPDWGSIIQKFDLFVLERYLT